MNYFYCPKCDGLYDGDWMLDDHNKRGSDRWYKWCPKAGCCGKAFQIDESMILPIRRLNAKGYKTRFSCAGHIKGTGGYIGFDPEYAPSTSPKGWKYEEPTDGYLLCIRYSFKDNMNDLAKYKMIQTKINSLIKWSYELPPCEVKEENNVDVQTKA